MNIKNNRRRRESIERIEKVFIELLQTKELHEISVSDICKRCELNRSTFYANYSDIYELADKIRETLEKEVNLLYEAETTQKFNSNDYLRLFHVKKHRKKWKKLSAANIRDAFHYNRHEGAGAGGKDSAPALFFILWLSSRHQTDDIYYRRNKTQRTAKYLWKSILTGGSYGYY